jgi:hypothetical protein
MQATGNYPGKKSLRRTCDLTGAKLQVNHAPIFMSLHRGSRFSGDSPLARTTVAQDDSEEDMADRIEAIVMPIFMSATQR